MHEHRRLLFAAALLATTALVSPAFAESRKEVPEQVAVRREAPILVAQLGPPSWINPGGLGPICPGPGALCQLPAITYVGPGDIQTFQVWYGLRAYSAAKRGTAAVQLCNVGDVVCADVVSDAVTGKLPNAPVIGSITCGSGANLCTIKIFYDQTGGNNCGGTCNLTQATVNSRAQWTPSCSGLGASTPCATGPTGGGQYATYISSGNFAALGQPFSAVIAAERTGANPEEVIGGNYAHSWAFAAAANAFTDSTVYNATATDNAWHAITVLDIAGASNGSINIDGTQTTGTVTWSFSGSTALAFMSNLAGGANVVGHITETGIIPASAAGNLTTFNSNIHTFWGF